ncbi:AN1-type zinc finger protein 4 isoform X2 [Takifugu flavidus]|uniref:AN1-type zinc finger protein 4 isoform X2 n=1 Tax=Takifugu flavidus TaxID=433684 RepID=UPI0025447B86|nr:AN1-type zinc finger protein 4 isoform X2 [Takifugu flavidus]
MSNKKEPPFFNDKSMRAFHYKLPFYDTMELFIETLTGTCFELRVLPFEAVISVKAKIQRLEGIPVAQQHLIWNNLELDDEHCLHDYGIAEGCTLKLVLALRGGPINTRRVTMEDPIKEVADMMENTKEEGWEKSLANKQVTFVVYREGDQLNFFRVLDRGDGTLTPLSESISGNSLYNVCTEEEDGENCAASQQSLENSITMNKMKLLKAKMEDMNLNKKPKKSAKVKPRPPGSSLGPSSTRHHHRLLRSVPHLHPPWQTSAHLPPIADWNSHDLAGTSAHPSVPRRPPPSSPTPCPPFSKIRPPPKVSRLDIGSTRLVRDCVYPQLPPLCIRGPPEATFDPGDPAAEAVGLGLLEEASGLVVPPQPAAPFGELSDPLSLDATSVPDGGHHSLEVGAQHQLSHSPPAISTWTLGTSDNLTSRTDKTLLGTSFHISPPSPSLSPPARCLQPSLQPPSSPRTKAGSVSPHSSTTPSLHSAQRRGVKVQSPGKRPELISQREARSITIIANQAYKEPVGSVSDPDLLVSLSSRAPDSSSSHRDNLRENLGLAISLSSSITLGQDTFRSRRPSNTNSRLLLDDLSRQISQSHQAAASYMVSDAVESDGVVASFTKMDVVTTSAPPTATPRLTTARMTTRAPGGDSCRRPTL